MWLYIGPRSIASGMLHEPLPPPPPRAAEDSGLRFIPPPAADGTRLQGLRPSALCLASCRSSAVAANYTAEPETMGLLNSGRIVECLLEVSAHLFQNTPGGGAFCQGVLRDIHRTAAYLATWARIRIHRIGAYSATPPGNRNTPQRRVARQGKFKYRGSSIAQCSRAGPLYTRLGCAPPQFYRLTRA